MARQLTLLEAPAGWRLDERTRAIGRQGVADARAALAAARRPAPAPRTTPPAPEPARRTAA